MKFRVEFLASGNRFSSRCVIHPILDLTADERPEDVAARAVEAIAVLAEHRQSPWNFSNLVDRVNGNESVNELIAVLGVMLQRIAGVDNVELVRFKPTNGAIETAFECCSRLEGFVAAEAVWQLCRRSGGAHFTLEELSNLTKKLSGEISKRVGNMPVTAAERLGIPWSFTAAANYPVVSLGQGKKRRLFWRHMTIDTPHIGSVVSTQKNLASEALGQVGLPVPKNSVVKQLDDAIAAARRIGWPVVTKPMATDYGTAVTTNIMDEKTLASGFAEARKHGPVLIEKHVFGDNHRLLVFNDKCISAVRQTPAHVVGDGVHSVQQLIEMINRSRSERLTESWKKIKVDENARLVLEREGFHLTDVPPPDKRVYLRYHTNLSVGGTMENITDEVHPDNARLAVKAASALGIDLAGIDFMTTDIKRSHYDVGGAIVEINVNPGFVMGEEEHVIEDHIFGAFFPLPDRGRIPIFTLLEHENSAGLDQQLKPLIKPNGKSVATIGPEGTWLDGNQIGPQGLSLHRQTTAALSDHDVEGAVLAFSPASFLAAGLGLNRVNVAIATDLDTPGMQEAMVGLARIADAVVLPSQSVKHFKREHFAKTVVWCTGEISPDTELPPLFNLLYLRGDKTIMMKRAGETSCAIRMPPSYEHVERKMLVTMVAVAAAHGAEDHELHELIK
jgi:cyanophycin synthetase